MKHLIFCFVALTCVSEAFVVVPPGRRAAAVALQRATKADSQERMDELVKKWSDLVKEKEAGKNPDKVRSSKQRIFIVSSSRSLPKMNN